MTALTNKKVLLEVAELKVHFNIHGDKQWFWQPPKTLKAVDGMTLRLFESETLGVWLASLAVVSQLSPVPLSAS